MESSPTKKRKVEKPASALAMPLFALPEGFCHKNSIEADLVYMHSRLDGELEMLA